MIVKAQTEQLREAVSKVLTVVDKKNTRPILTYILLKAKNNSIEISATDTEVSTKLIVPSTVEKEGEFCVNVKNINDILKELPNAEISLSVEEENLLKISCGDIQYSLLIHPSDDFPQLIFENSEKSFNLTSEQVLEIISKTLHAISNDETRIHLNGIYLQEIDSSLRAVATDGHRLSLLEVELNQNNIDCLVNGVILPRKGVFELKKLAETFPNHEINISIDESFFYASINNQYSLSARLISREYPKYQAGIPNKTSFTMRVEKSAFSDATKRIKIMSNEKSNQVKLKLTDGQMTLMANHPSLGHALETLAIDYTGKEIEFGLNAKYLLDALSVIEGDEISLEFNNELSPIVIKSNASHNYLGIIMPLRL